MSRFPEIEKKPNGISLEKAIENHDKKIAKMLGLKRQLRFYEGMLDYFGPYNDYKEESGLYDQDYEDTCYGSMDGQPY